MRVNDSGSKRSFSGVQSRDLVRRIEGPYSFQCLECGVLFSLELLSPRMARGLQSHQPSYQQSSAALRDVSRVLGEVDEIDNERSTVSDVSRDSEPRYLVSHVTRPGETQGLESVSTHS